jgi:hypothetical protein
MRRMPRDGVRRVNVRLASATLKFDDKQLEQKVEAVGFDAVFDLLKCLAHVIDWHKEEMTLLQRAEARLIVVLDRIERKNAIAPPPAIVPQAPIFGARTTPSPSQGGPSGSPAYGPLLLVTGHQPAAACLAKGSK